MLVIAGLVGQDLLGGGHYSKGYPGKHENRSLAPHHTVPFQEVSDVFANCPIVNDTRKPFGDRMGGRSRLECLGARTTRSQHQDSGEDSLLRRVHRQVALGGRKKP